MVAAGTPTSMTGPPISSSAAGRAPWTSHAVRMPTGGTSRTYGTTAPAGYRASRLFQTTYPSSDAPKTVYAVLRIAAGGRWPRVCSTAERPSSSNERPNAGTGTTRADQTTRDRPEDTRAPRLTTLPTAQDAAAPSVTSSGSTGELDPWATATTTSPVVPM